MQWSGYSGFGLVLDLNMESLQTLFIILLTLWLCVVTISLFCLSLRVGWHVSPLCGRSPSTLLVRGDSNWLQAPRKNHRRTFAAAVPRRRAIRTRGCGPHWKLVGWRFSSFLHAESSSETYWGSMHDFQAKSYENYCSLWLSFFWLLAFSVRVL